MNQFKQLGRPAQIAIPAVIAVVLFIVLYMTMLSGPSMATVQETTDPDQVAAWTWKLEGSKVKYQVVQPDAEHYQINVVKKDEAKARQAISGSGLGSRLKSDSIDLCTPPSQFATRAQTDAFNDCKTEAKIHGAIVGTKGVLEAKVKVVTQDSGSLVGSGTESNITVQLFPEADAEKPLDPESLATQIANMAEGGSPDRVVITDQTGSMLWNKGKGATTAASAGSCASASSQPINDITTKEQAVKGCIEQDVLKKISEMVGGPTYASVVAGVTLSPAAETVNASEVTRGALLDVDTQSNSDGGQKQVNDSRKYSPNTTNTTSMKGAGYIDRLSLAVTLDSSHVTPAMESTVRNFLKGYVDPRRGDPVPSVLSTKFASEKSSGKASTGGADGAPAAGKAGATAPTAEDLGVTATTHIPRKIMALAFLLLVGLVTTIALLWRRGTTLTTERGKFEAEFQNDQRWFRDFAQSNPDELANDMNQLFGSPVRQPVNTP